MHKLLQATAFGFMVGRNHHLPTFLARLRAWKGQIPLLGGEGTATPAAHATRTHLEKGLSQQGSAHSYQVATPWGEPGSKSSSPTPLPPFPTNLFLPTQHQGLAQLSTSSHTTTKDLPLNTPLRTRMLWDRSPTSHGITRFRMVSTGEDSFGLNTNTPRQEHTMQENHAESEQ